MALVLRCIVRGIVLALAFGAGGALAANDRVSTVGCVGFAAVLAALEMANDVKRERYRFAAMTAALLDAARLADVLKEFVADVNTTGGLVPGDYFNPDIGAPAAAPDWPDLAATYEHACDVLDLEPKWQDEDPEA